MAKIAVLGLWHLGEIYSAGLAELGHEVFGISDDEKVVAGLTKDIPPLPEPRLGELLSKNRKAGRLHFTMDLSAIGKCDVLWVTFDTPVDDDDVADLSPTWDALRVSAPHLKNGTLIVVSSQVPVGTSKKIMELVAKENPGANVDYVYTPENLRLGEAVKCFFEPERIVVGSFTEGGFKRIGEIFSPLKANVVRMSPASAEITKHAMNAFFATTISFINDIADICEKEGGDVQDVITALRGDSRIGSRAALGAGLGFSGGTLGRDLRALMRKADEDGISLPVITSAFEKNRTRLIAVAERLREILGELKGKTIAVFGLTYKPGTKTLRRSRALELAARWSAEGAALRLHDPAAAEEEIPSIQNASFHGDIYAAAEKSDACVIATPWPEYKDINLEKLARAARPKAAFFDTANLFYGREEELKRVGFNYYGIGR